MEAFLILLTGQSENIIYFLLFCVLFFSGLGLPVPEDAVLLSGGFLLYFGYTDFLPTVLVGFFGVVCGDTLIFHIGKRWGTDAVRHRSLARLLTPGRLARVQRYFQKYGSMTILLARFLVVLRAPTFLLAGSMYMPFRRFFWMDFMAALVSVPLVTYLGFVFAPQLENLLRLLRRVEVAVLLLVLLLGVVVYWYRRSRNRQAA